MATIPAANPMMTAPVLVVPFSHKDAYLDRYAEPDKGWTDRDEARWPVPYWWVDAGMAALLRAWLDHRHVVLVRRTEHRLAAIARRLEILEGYLVVYLNLDEVIRIIRTEDEPKPVLMARFGLDEVQAEYILETKLKQLARLEEMKIRGEQAELMEERDALERRIAALRGELADRLARHRLYRTTRDAILFFACANSSSVRPE